MTIIKGIILILNLAIACAGGSGIPQVEMTYEVPAGTVHAVQQGNKITGKLGEEIEETIEYKFNERGELIPTSIYKSLLPLERA